MFLLVFSTFSLQAQDSLVSKHIQQLYKIWEKAYAGEDTPKTESNINALFTYYDEQRIDSSMQSYLSTEVYLKKADYYRKETGLSISGNYLENLGTAFGDIEDNIFYNRRFQLGLKWDVLKNGFLSTQNQSEQAKIQAELEKLQPNKTSQKENYIRKWHELSYLFNTQKIDLLHQRASLLDTTTLLAENLHFLGFFSKEELIKLYSKQAEILSLMRVYQSYNEEYLKITNAPDLKKDLPLLDILPLVFAVDSLWEQTNNDSLIAKEMQLIELQNKWIHDVSLSPYLRYNYYDLVAPANFRSFFSTGFSFNIPIPFNNKAERAYLEAKLKAKYDQVDESIDLLQQDALTQFYEYRYKLKQYIAFHYKSVLLQEQLRQENARKEVTPLRFNPIDAIQILDELTAVQLEMIDLKQNMYLKILRLQLALNHPEAKYLFHPVSLNKIKEQKSTLELYCWSAAINDYETEKILGFAELNNIKSLLLSLPKNAHENPKYKSFFQAISSRNIGLKLMIGDNQLIRKNVKEELDARFGSLTNVNYTELHLDVEPHTFPDWKENKTTYLDEYLIMLKEAKTWCEKRQKKLSVSIPLHYPESTVQEILKLCDKVYFMAYENIKTDYIIRKIENYDKEKTVIALRTNDFVNRLAMENKISELENAGFKQFIYHDFKSLYTFK